MRQRRFIVFCLCGLALLWLVFTVPATAVTVATGPLVGVMVQPTSYYFHLVRGGAVSVGTDNDLFTMQAGYVERPPFTAAGFVDQDFFHYVTAGTDLLKNKSWRLVAGAGVGRVFGMIGDQTKELPTRRYLLNGLTTSAELGWRYKSFDVALNYFLFSSRTSRSQAEAYVSWPYHFITLRFGYAI